MIRRLPAALASVALAATIASGCSTFTKNNNAATVSGRHLSITEFETLSNDLAPAPNSFGEKDGNTVRGILSAWVRITALIESLKAKGLTISDAQRAAAEKSLSASETGWATFKPSTKTLEIEFSASQTLIASNTDLVPDATVQAAYESGVTASNVLCLRLMAFSDFTKAQSISDQLSAGGDFASLAIKNSEDTSTAPGGGIEQNNGNECFLTTTLGQSTQLDTLLQSVGTAPVGQPTKPIQIGSFYYILLERPYSEVSTHIRPLMTSLLAAPIAKQLTSSAKAVIDSRYGMWDATTGQVVSTR